MLDTRRIQTRAEPGISRGWPAGPGHGGAQAQNRDVAFQAVLGQPGACLNFLPRGPGARSST